MVHRLITLNGRLNLSGFSLLGFKRNLSVVKRSENTLDGWARLEGSLPGFQGLQLPERRASAAELLWVCMFFASVLNLNAASERYEFTDNAGRKLEAMILECNSKEVEVERVSDGRRFSLSLDTLSQKTNAT